MNRGTMGVNSLPKPVTRHRRGCDLNPGPTAPESGTLTTRLPSHPAYSTQWQLPVSLRQPRTNPSIPRHRLPLSIHIFASHNFLSLYPRLKTDLFHKFYHRGLYSSFSLRTDSADPPPVTAFFLRIRGFVLSFSLLFLLFLVTCIFEVSWPAITFWANVNSLRVYHKRELMCA